MIFSKYFKHFFLFLGSATLSQGTQINKSVIEEENYPFSKPTQHRPCCKVATRAMFKQKNNDTIVQCAGTYYSS